MTLCPRCKGATVLPAQFLGNAPEQCQECGGTGTVLTNGNLEWVRLDWTPTGEEFPPPQIVLEPMAGCRRLSLREARRVADRIRELADWGERVAKRLEEIEE